MVASKKTFTVVESPFSAKTKNELLINLQYAILAVRDSLSRGEAPYASHLFYTQMLDDNDVYERQQGIEAGLNISRLAEQTVVYSDLGISNGMKYGIESAVSLGRSVMERRLFEASESQDIAQLVQIEYLRYDLPPIKALEAVYGRIIKNLQT